MTALVNPNRNIASYRVRSEPTPSDFAWQQVLQIHRHTIEKWESLASAIRPQDVWQSTWHAG